jgi:membrane protein
VRRAGGRDQAGKQAPASGRASAGGAPEARREDRGRAADRPSEIPRPGWRDILWRVWQQVGEHNVSIIAAGVAFYSLLAIFPAITAFVSFYGLIADPGSVEKQVSAIGQLIPAEALNLISTQLHSVVSAGSKRLGLSAVVSIVIAVWSAGAGVRALMTALNIAYREEEKRGYLRFYGTAFAFTVGLIIAAMVAILVVVALPVVLQFLPLGDLAQVTIKLLTWLILAVMIIFGLGVLYRYGPSREPAKGRWISWGAVIAAVLWLLVSVLFSVYAANFANYSATYGTLSAVIALLMWFWLSAFVILVGAELNAEMEHQTAKDTTTGQPKPMGERGAFVADHVGKVP